MIRILYERVISDGKRYIEAVGLSTDTKPSGCITGSKFLEVDTGKNYRYDETGAEWDEYSSGGGGGGDEDYAIVLRPFDQTTRTMFCVQTSVLVGDKITVTWKADDEYPSRYFMSTRGASVDGGQSYQSFNTKTFGASGTRTMTVTTAGAVAFGGVSAGYSATNNLIGDYVKVKIERTS